MKDKLLYANILQLKIFRSFILCNRHVYFVQMSLSGMRDFSQINSPPKGRLEVKIHVGNLDRSLIRTALLKEFQRNGQVFVVVPLVQQVHPTKLMLQSLFEGEFLPDGTSPLKVGAGQSVCFSIFINFINS